MTIYHLPDEWDLMPQEAKDEYNNTIKNQFNDLMEATKDLPIPEDEGKQVVTVTEYKHVTLPPS